MKYEYCQVNLKIEYNPTFHQDTIVGEVEAYDKHNNVIAKSSRYITMFNQLGNDGWHLILETESSDGLSIYFFERTIEE